MNGQFPSEPSLAPDRPSGRPDKALVQEDPVDELFFAIDTPELLVPRRALRLSRRPDGLD